MKKILTIILTILLITTSTWATHYYFSPNGADGNSGTSTADPWQTVGKFQTLISSLNPGDTVSFQSGQNWDEFYAIIDNIDGAYGNPIVFNTYGSGRRAVLKGTKDFSGTMSVGGNLYSISGDSDIGDITWPNVFRQIWIDSIYYPPSRYPNTGMLDVESGTSTSISETDVTFTTNDHIGGVVVGYFTAWEWTQGLISGNGTHTLSFNSLTYEDGSNTITPGAGDYYFILGSQSPTATDLDGESYYDDDGFTIYWSADNLNSGHKVECTVVDTMWHIEDCSYLKFENLIFEKVNQYTFVLENSDNITITGCGMNWSNGGHIRGYYSDSIYVNHNFFHETQNACNFFEYSGYVKLENNDFKNITVRQGLRNLNTRYNSCFGSGHADDSVVFRYNNMDSIASGTNMHYTDYDSYNFGVYIGKNVGVNYGMTDVADNALFYQGGEWDSRIRKTYHKNIGINAYNNRTNYSYGTSTQEFFHFMYCDYNSSGATYDDNVMFNGNEFIFVNGGSSGSGTNLRFSNNITYNAAKDMTDQWGSLLHFSNSGSNGYPKNDTAYSNYFVFGYNPYERVYAFSDYSGIADGIDFDNNSILDPFTYSNNDMYREINSYSVTNDWNLSEVCGNRDVGCNSTFNDINWDYSDVSGTYSTDEFVVSAWNGTNDDFYLDLGNCTVKDVETGINYTDSVQIPDYGGKVFFMVSGTRSTIGDTANWNAPLTWYEELNDTSFAEEEDSECLYYISVNDTSVTTDSIGYYFENNMNTAYGDYDLNVSGTPTYQGYGNCQGSYSYYPDNNATVYTDQVDLGEYFELEFCYNFYGDNTGHILANRSTGDGWELNRGTGECLEFVTHNGVTSDTVQSAAYAIGVNGTTYDVRVIADKANGYVSMFVDGSCVTPSDSVIQTDFNTDDEIYIGCDAGGEFRYVGYY